jgi:phosphoserine phosphatase
MRACATRNCGRRRTFVKKFVPQRIFAEMADLVAELRASGVDLWAVSSTNRWVIAEGVRAFGIPEERILAAEVRVADGLITSEIVRRAHR